MKEDEVAPEILCFDQRLYSTSTMIAHLSGTLLTKHTNTVILDVGGVGYEVTIPLSTF